MDNFKETLKSKLKNLIENNWNEVYLIMGTLVVIVVIGLIGSVFSHTKDKFDCSDRAEVVVEKVLMCEQNRTNERIREKELKLEKYKVDQNYKFNALKEKLLVIREEVKVKGFSDALHNLGVESLNASREFLATQESCPDEVIRSMCKVVN